MFYPAFFCLFICLFVCLSVLSTSTLKAFDEFAEIYPTPVSEKYELTLTAFAARRVDISRIGALVRNAAVQKY